MEDNFRNTLIIISAVVIGAFFVHGMWTIRKNKNPYKLKTDKKNKNTPAQARNFDHSGFDQDGVGQIKVKDPSNGLDLPEDQSDQPSFHATKGEAISTSETPIEDLLIQAMATEQNETVELASEALFSTENSVTENEEPALPELEEIITPVYQEPVISPKPIIAKVKTKTISKAELKRNQIEINFGHLDVESDIMPTISAIEQETDQNPSNVTSIKPEVLAISVVMPQNQIMQGASLLPSLLTLGLKYGEMNIFHRHQDNAGNGPVTFSLANMINPGSFDLDTMETFATQGVTLFMMLPNTGNAFDVYIQMLAAAKQLAQEFQAQLLDDKRNVMTKQTEQHYTSRIREFEIKNRTAAI